MRSTKVTIWFLFPFDNQHVLLLPVEKNPSLYSCKVCNDFKYSFLDDLI